MKKRFPLFWKLYPPFLLIVLIPLLAVSWYADFSMRRFFLDQTAINLEARANLLKEQMTGYLLAEDWKNIDILVQTGRKILRHADYGNTCLREKFWVIRKPIRIPWRIIRTGRSL